MSASAVWPCVKPIFCQALVSKLDSQLWCIPILSSPLCTMPERLSKVLGKAGAWESQQLEDSLD